MKKYLLLFITLLLLITPVKAESKYLYDVLKEEAEKEGGLAKEYTREHQDTVDNSGTEKIYYYTAHSDAEAESIINKRNVIFGGFCWEMFRTTDSGGVKLLYNGLISDGKCYGTNQSIGRAEYTTYDNISKVGSVGYMYNKLYSTNTIMSPNYGSYRVDGQNLSETDYKNVTNNLFEFTQDEWHNSKDTNGYASDGNISFNVTNNGNYILEYFLENDYYSDNVKIYLNNNVINTITSQQRGYVDLNNLKSSDVIKVELNVRENDNITDFKFSVKEPSNTIIDTRAYFGNSVTYSNGKYTLIDTIRSDGTENLSYNHYFCLDGSLSCDEVYYAAMWYNPTRLESYKLTDGMKIEDYINDQLYADNVNQNDSQLKKYIEGWYKYNFTDYTVYLEDTVFCQNRKLANQDNAFNPNGGNPTGGERKTHFFRMMNANGFDENNPDYLYNTNLKCDNITDRFSISNDKAKLTYPVATINLAEALLMFKYEYDYSNLTGQRIRGHHNSYYYWLLSPYDLNVTYGWGVSRDGGIYYSYGASKNEVRPVVSLKKGATYSSGDGSVDNPYVFESIYSSVNIKTINETNSINVEIDDLTQVEYNEEVKFKVTPIKGYRLNNIKVLDADNNEIEFTATENENEYMFTMPTSDVTIIPSYEKVSNSVTVEENSSEQIIIEVNDSSAVLYEDKVKIKVQEKDGYKLTGIKIIDIEGNEIEYTPTENNGEYEFTMPASNVVITPIYEIITVPDTEKNKDYTLYFVLAGLALVLGIVYILLNKKKK